MYTPPGFPGGLQAMPVPPTGPEMTIRLPESVQRNAERVADLMGMTVPELLEDLASRVDCNAGRTFLAVHAIEDGQV